MKRVCKKTKNNRTLDMYARLCEGKVINKQEEAARFGVDSRSIQRDIDDIRCFLAERKLGGKEGKDVVYDRARKGYVIVGEEPSMMTNSEILAVSKILLESRAFTKKEITILLDKLVEGCVPLKNMKLVSDLIANEKYHYIEPQHKTGVKDVLWEMGENIKAHEILGIKYVSLYSNAKAEIRIIEPVGIIFSEYYFYLIAYLDEKNETGEVVHMYDYPVTFRVDRIKSYKKLGEKFQIPYSSRFEEGEFRKRVQFMFAGKLTHVEFKYYGKNPEFILDRIPTAKIIKQDEEAYYIEAEAYGKGLMMWLLSQGSQVEVTGPKELRNKLKQELLGMLERY